LVDVKDWLEKMSKAPKKPDAKKSKDVKGKTVSAEKQQNTTYIEIVPGKFNENDWNNLLEIDESQEFIWELLDECIENANKQIHQKYLDNQTVPFTINEAKKAILHLIDVSEKCYGHLRRMLKYSLIIIIFR